MLSRHLVQVQEDERRALSRDLHDTSGQAMTVLNLGLAALKHEGECTDKMQARIDDLRRVVETVAQDLHRLSVNLRPSSLDRYGLVPALDQFLGSIGEQAKIDIRFEVDGLDERLPGDIETALFRIAQEAATNIARYSRATEATLLLRRAGEEVSLTVADNGQGFDVEEALGSGRLGLLGMRERAEMLGGSFSIEAARGRGTRLAVVMPLPGSPAAPPDSSFGRQPPAGPLPAAAAAGVAAELARAKAHSDVLVDIMAGATQSTTADGILSLVLQRTSEVIGCDTVHIDVRDGAHWVTRYDLRRQETGRRFEEEQVPALMWVERTREVLVVNDTAGDVPDEVLRLSEYGVRSYALVPLASHASLWGILCFINFQAPEPFAPSEIEFFNRLAALVALALENIQLSETQAEQRDLLARRVEELETLLEVLPVGIGIANDLECKDIRTNPAFARMLDLPTAVNASLSADEPEKPHNFRVLRDGRELAPEELPMQVAAATGQPVSDLVVDVIRDDGARLTLLEYAAPLHDASGRPRGSVGAFVDITDRLAGEVEKARLLVENQRQGRLLSDLLSNMPVGVSIMRGREYRYEMVNGIFEQLLGVRAGDVIGRTIAEAFPGAAASAVALWDKVWATGETLWIHEQVFNVGPGREETYWDGLYVPMRDESGAIDGVMVLASEVTAQVLERKAAEQTSYTLNALLDFIPEGITIADAPDVTIRHVSRYGRELLGGEHDDLTAGEVAQQWAILEPDGVTPMAEEDLPLVRAIRHGETVRDREVVQVNAQGVPIPLLCTAGPIRNEAGEVTGGIVAWRDIREMKQAQTMLAQREAAVREALKAAQESEERYRLLFETMDEGFMLVEILRDEDGNDQDFRILDMNPAAMAFAGVSRGQVVGRISREVDPDRDDSWLEFYGRVARTGLPERFRNYAAFEDRWYELHAFSPGPALTAVLYKDITQNLRVEADLRAANAELESILNAVADGLIVNDAAGRVSRMNAVAEYMLGYTEEDRALPIHERIPAKMQLLQPDGTPCPLEEYPPVAALKGKVSVARELLLRATRVGHRETRVLASAGPIYTAQGDFLGAVTLLTDISELHEARMRLVEANTRLTEQSARFQVQADAELRVLARRLVEMQERERSYVADRLYNETGQVLSALNIQLSLLEKRQCEPESLAELAQIKLTLEQTIRQLHGLAAHLHPFELNHADLAEILRSYIEDFGRSHNVAVTYETIGTSGLRPPSTSSLAVYRAVQEGLANIAQHAAADNVKLSVVYAEGTLSVTLADDGSGFQTAGVTPRGAGLLGMRERIETVGGKLAVESSPAGTILKIEIPLHP